MHERPDPTEATTYSVGALADAADVSRRTVRYYVQRELLAPPIGVGRGAHYTGEHLARLLRIKDLQESGVPLADIPAHLDGPDASAPAPADPPPEPPHETRWRRIVVAPGVELSVREDVADPRRVAALVAQARALFPSATTDQEPADEHHDPDRR